MPVSTEQQLEQKYASAIGRAKQLGAKIEKSHVEDNKLVLRAAVPNETVKNQIWDAVKAVDQNYADLRLDLHIDPSLQQPATGGGSTGGAERTYTVQRGDTLSAIAEKFYGRASEYNKIFHANRDKLKDPDKIQVGQVLKIPE